jgi:hypothetical protein
MQPDTQSFELTFVVTNNDTVLIHFPTVLMEVIL